MDKQKKIKVIISVLLICVLAFAIYWKASETERSIKARLKGIQTSVDAFRSGKQDSFHFFFPDYVAEDPRIAELLASLVKEMCENQEDEMLLEFLDALEDADYCSETLAAILNEHLGASSDLEYVFGFIDSSKFQFYLDYYNTKVNINRNTGLLAAYIEEHGSQPFTTTPREGYYAKEKDTYSRDVVGLPTSPLYDSVSVTHLGDFKYKHEYGVKLNAYYEETAYSRYTYYFRGNIIPFSLNDGEIVWSGDYLLCFDYSGNLIGFQKIDTTK